MVRWRLALWGMLVFFMTAGRARAELVCTRPVVDAGTIRSGVPLLHTFALRNSGPENVEIVRVKPGCGCQRTQLKKRFLAAGEQTLLEVEVNTLTQAEGPNRWRAVVYFRCGPAQRELPLDIVASIVCEVSVQPASLLVYTDAAISPAFTLTDRRARPLSVRAVTTTSPHVRPAVGAPHRSAAGTWEWTLALHIDSTCPDGRHEEMLHICTDDASYPDLKVPFTVVKRSRRRVPAVPAEVAVTGSGHAPLPARIVLLGSGEEEVRVKRVEADHPAVQCRWAPGPGVRVTLKIRIDRERISGPAWKGSVRVLLSRPEGETVTIPVSCTLR